ncbi:MAG TPA: hypothetical protein VEK79_10760 [Thermoanaerobaculia bacterium]|nr:hypothetical protein [Thermoanaerobaculia bacterium]
MFIGGEHTSDIWLERNTIAHNAWFGLAIDRRQHRYTLVDNSITRNGFIGIDRGLDGFDGYAFNVDHTNVTSAQVPPPRVLSAIYDPSTNLTTITGTYFRERENFRSAEITLYANSLNDGQGETVLGTTSTPSGMFAFNIPGDLTGKFITATGRYTLDLELGGVHFWNTEFSESIAVSPIQ